MEYTDLSLDLETLARSPKSLILSIGFCFFNRKTGEQGPSGQYYVNPLSQPLRDINLSTVKWWMGQSKEAKSDLWGGLRNSIPLGRALGLLEREIKAAGNKNLTVWGNGPEFDNVILQDAYKGNPPWSFWANGSVRTAVLLAEDKSGTRLKKVRPFNGTKHDAKADAIHQAKLIIASCDICTETP